MGWQDRRLAYEDSANYHYYDWADSWLVSERESWKWAEVKNCKVNYEE